MSMSTETDDFQSEFIFGSDKVQVTVDRDKKQVHWKHLSKEKSEQCSVSLEDIYSTSSSGNCWTIYCVVRELKKWHCNNVTFEGSNSELCSQWAENVRQAAVHSTGIKRPNRLLVFINPDSGSKTGVRDYQKHAQPILTRAEVEADIVVTEDILHPERVLEKYDLSSIDGVVSVGGDGTFMYVITGLLKRHLQDCGKDLDDPEGDIPPCPTTAAILPAGTGQANVRKFTGLNHVDMCSATLQIVLGYSHQPSIFALYQDRKLISFPALHVMYGCFGDMLEYTETRRWMGRARYIFGILEFLLKKSITGCRKFNLKCNFLPDSNEKDEEMKQEWQTHEREYINVAAFLFDPAGVPFEGAGAHLVDSSAGITGIVRWFTALFSGKIAPDGYDFLTSFKPKALQCNFVPPQEGSRTFPLNVDGDLFYPTKGMTDIRLHRKVLNVFGLGIT